MRSTSKSPTSKQQPSTAKSIVRGSWKTALYLLVLFFGRKKPYNKDGDIKLFYGGARSRGIGGPIVKVHRLKQYFPQKISCFNVVYSLSNAPYLGPASLDLIRKRRIPLVHNQNGVFYSGWYYGDWRSENSIMAVPYHAADYVFWQSRFCRQAASKFLGPRKGPGEILYNAVDTNVFYPNEPSVKKRFSFLLSGKFNTHILYRIEAAIAGLALAIKQGLKADLQIAGWMENPELVHRMIVEFNVEEFVHLLGAYDHRGAPEIYRSADAFVMLKYLDPCPNTVIEALSSGLPIVYSDSGGVPELVGRDAGVGMQVPLDWSRIYTPKEAQIAASMLEVYDKRSSMAEAARQRAIEMFDMRNWINRHDEIFRELLEAKN